MYDFFIFIVALLFVANFMYYLIVLMKFLDKEYKTKAEFHADLIPLYLFWTFIKSVFLIQQNFSEKLIPN